MPQRAPLGQIVAIAKMLKKAIPTKDQPRSECREAPGVSMASLTVRSR